MDQRKTAIPFFLNPSKSVSGDFVLKTKLMGVKVKLSISFLVVGHTHEDIDQYFSCISRFIKKIKKSICSVRKLNFLNALMEVFSSPGCIPKCIQEVSYCYDTKPIVDSLDSHFARFNLQEKTGEKVEFTILFQTEFIGEMHNAVI